MKNEKDVKNALYFIVIPRHLNVNNPEFGVWDAVKRKSGEVKSFHSAEEARQYAKKKYTFQEYYIFQLVG